MGMHPRWIRADLAYANTQRTIDRQFLFKPDPTVRNIIGASAARAQKKHPVKLYWLEYNINHEQEGVAPLSDSPQHLNNVVLFKKTFHRILAEELNRYYGREGGIFSTPARTVPCLDNVSLEQQFFYALTNPVKDGLVDRLSHWKGFSSYNQLARGEDEVFTYYDRTAWHKSGQKKPIQAFMKSARVEFTPLPSLENMKPEERRMYIRREVRLIEQSCREQRALEGRRVMTPARLQRTDPRDRPVNRPKRTPKPLCHCSSPGLAKEYKDMHLEFLKSYRISSAYYRSGVYDVEFPPGSFKPPLIELAA